MFKLPSRLCAVCALSSTWFHSCWDLSSSFLMFELFLSACCLFLLNVAIVSVVAVFALVIVNLKYEFWYHCFCWLFCHWIVASFAKVCLVSDHRKETLTWAEFEDLACEYINQAVNPGTLGSKIKLKFKLQKRHSCSWQHTKL